MLLKLFSFPQTLFMPCITKVIVHAAKHLKRCRTMISTDNICRKTHGSQEVSQVKLNASISYTKRFTKWITANEGNNNTKGGKVKKNKITSMESLRWFCTVLNR